MLAAERHTTLKAMLEHALRRELLEVAGTDGAGSPFQLNAFGFPVLRSPGESDQVVTSENVYRLLEEDA